jgi:5-formyltetrahydrofolate cyclo-ligase
MSEISMTKPEFRESLRARIASLTPVELRESDRAITEQLLQLPEVQACNRVYAYVPYGREISTLAALSHFRRLSKYVAICWDWPPDRLPEQGDIIIVPGLTFDSDGYRIGKGGGFYDRLLAAAPGAFSIGLARDTLLAPLVPRESHDMHVDALVTESRVLRFRSHTG